MHLGIVTFFAGDYVLSPKVISFGDAALDFTAFVSLSCKYSTFIADRRDIKTTKGTGAEGFFFTDVQYTCFNHLN